MDKASQKLVDRSIQRQGDDWWNDPNDKDGGEPSPNRIWVIDELIELLAKENFRLELFRIK